MSDYSIPQEYTVTVARQQQQRSYEPVPNGFDPHLYAQSSPQVIARSPVINNPHLAFSPYNSSPYLNNIPNNANTNMITHNHSHNTANTHPNSMPTSYQPHLYTHSHSIAGYSNSTSHPANPIMLTGRPEDSLLQPVSEEHLKAISTWSNRLKVAAFLHLVTLGCMLHSYYWFTTAVFLGLLLAIWAYCAVTKKHQGRNLVWLYVLLILMNFVKNTLICFFSIRGGNLTPYEVFLMILIVVDDALFTPLSLYCCFYLHRSINVSYLRL